MTNTVDTNSYQTYLKNCDCPNGGIIIYQGKAVCRWCRKPYSEGSKMNYLPEHFQQSIPNKQDERIGVNLSRGFNTKSQFQWVCHFYCTKEIKDKDFPEIKNLLERYLNGEMDNPAPTESRLNSKEPLSKVYNSMLFKTDDGEELALCIRDSGYEFKYFGHWYEAKEGIVKPRGQQKTYTQSEVDTIREETWQSARLRKYDTLQDYLNSLSEKKDHYFFNGVKIPFGNPSENKPSIKPPLGLMPLWLWEEHRLKEIGAAIERYKEAVKEIPQEWINEQYDLSKKIKPSTTPIEDKGWEIVSFKHIDYGIMFKDLQGYYQHVSNHGRGWCISLEEALKNTRNMTIFSVKRLSDNEVFTVGKFNNGKKIEKFYIGWSGMEIHYTDGSGSLLLEEPFLPQQPPPKTQDKGNVLFTTEDGVDIKDNLTYYYGVRDFKHGGRCNGMAWYHREEGNKYFSTREAAEQYILENKPCLSLSDLQKEWFMEDEQVQFGKWEGIPMYRRFQQIVKKKLNQ